MRAAECERLCACGCVRVIVCEFRKDLADGRIACYILLWSESRIGKEELKKSKGDAKLLLGQSHSMRELVVRNLNHRCADLRLFHWSALLKKVYCNGRIPYLKATPSLISIVGTTSTFQSNLEDACSCRVFTHTKTPDFLPRWLSNQVFLCSTASRPRFWTDKVYVAKVMATVRSLPDFSANRALAMHRRPIQQGQRAHSNSQNSNNLSKPWNSLDLLARGQKSSGQIMSKR